MNQILPKGHLINADVKIADYDTDWDLFNEALREGRLDEAEDIYWTLTGSHNELMRAMRRLEVATNRRDVARGVRKSCAGGCWCGRC